MLLTSILAVITFAISFSPFRQHLSFLCNIELGGPETTEK